MAQGHSDGKCKFVWYWSIKKDKQDCFFNFCAKKGSLQNITKNVEERITYYWWHSETGEGKCVKCNIRESGLGEFFWRGYKRRQEVEIWDEGWQRMQISAVCQREGCQM